jgi:hypothetical protein
MKDSKVKGATVKASKKSAAATTQPPVDKKVLDKTIENHKNAAAHHMEAAKHHLDAVKHYEAGNSEKAAQSALLAHGNHAIAGEFLTDDAKHHAQTLKFTSFHH